MTPERWQIIIRLFEETRRIPDEIERDHHLAVQCADDPELLIEVKQLLDNEQAGCEQLDEPIFGTHLDLGMTDAMNSVTPDPASQISSGTHIGPYQIISPIGSGGMGIVYEAQQDQPSRHIALKMMRHAVLSRHDSLRFRREIEILGQLQHPNIAQVYDAGVYYTDSIRDSDEIGRPYFVMELISDAKNIINYAKHHHLNITQRLKLFLEVCRGVNHGHRKGIIHRDLKPGNILVGPDGHPKIIDFGVARVAESEQLNVTTVRTEIGLFVGTVQYMSPEQCEPDGETELLIDTRSDVYSLGVILYQLICRQLPYDVSNSSVIKAARTVCDTTIARPHEIDRKLKGNIDAILIKALNRDPDRRYQSAGELGQDINHHLQGQPVVARPPSFTDHATTLIRRHPILTTTTLSLLIALMVIGGSILGTRYLGKTPSHIVLDENALIARLYSVGENVLDVWKHVCGAELVERPPEFGGGQVALITYMHDIQAQYPDHLCLYDVGKKDQSEPIILPLPQTREHWLEQWLTQMDTPEEMDQYSSKHTQTADIFPDLPGEEFITVHTHIPEFPTAIRIYDLQGNILYERWHKGQLSSLKWNPATRQIICSGLRNDKFPEYQDVNLPLMNNVRILFAFQPDRNHEYGSTILNSEQELNEGVVWYLYMSPVVTWKMRGGVISIEPRVNEQDRVSIELLMISPTEAGGAIPGVRVMLNTETGQVIGTAPSNGYVIGEYAPDPDHIKLLPYPPKRDDLLDPQTRQ